MIRRRAPLAVAALLALSACGGSDSAGEGESSASAAENGADAGATLSGTTKCPPAKGAEERVVEFEQAPPMCIDEAKTYTATMATDAGEIEIELDAKAAPATVNNFVVLARYKFYDGLTFHRVIEGFMAQGGDPAGDGSGGPGYEVEDELPKQGEYEVGSVAMANSGPDTNGSQFFIVTGENGVQLPPDYSLFGAVTQGEEVVEQIESDGSQGEGRPETTHTIESVTITEE